MSLVLAMDPGISHPAAALFRDGELVSASRVKLKTAWSKLPMAERCLTIAREIRTWTTRAMGYPLERAYDTLDKLEYVFEWPQVYTKLKSKGDPNDLLPLAGVGMCLAGLLADHVDEFSVHSYKPREWAGNIPKTTTGDPLSSIRGQRVWKRLSEVERQAVVLSHDAVDAVGIGLKFLGRYEILRVYPGASTEPEPAPGEG